MNAPEPLPLAAPPRWRTSGLLHGLGPTYFTALAPQPLPGVHWVARSERLAAELGLAGWLHTPEALALLSGNALPAGSTPLASVYSGHQFGVWAGQLGDGRALLLGEADTPLGPQELQLKGSGLTPYSRMGDGRAVLRSSIREFLCSEAMHALGIPTTRALAVVGSPAPVRRETVETAAVVTRVAPSFLRFGHFEHFAHTARDVAALRTLANAVIERYYPGCQAAPQPVAALLQAVAERTAQLVAQWQLVGFCHGVMNTDNLSLLGLTIDYGPFGFLDGFDPAHVCNHSDERGRYAYARQPSVAFWNLHALAQALLPLVDDDQALLLAALEPYKASFEAAMVAGMRAKLGLATAQADDPALADDLVQLLAQGRVDWTIFWRRLCHWATEPDSVRDLFIHREAFDAWAVRYRERLATDGGSDAERRTRMRRTNPRVVLRNHLAETAIQAAQAGDFGPTQRLLKALESPYDEPPAPDGFDGFPPDWAAQLEVSCSS